MMTISTFSFFYLFALLFIWVEIFAFQNRGRVTKRLNFQDIENSSLRFYLIFFFLKTIYIFWLPIGLFGDLWMFFLILICLGIINLLIPLTRSKLIVFIFNSLNTFFSCIILLTILYQALFR